MGYESPANILYDSRGIAQAVTGNILMPVSTSAFVVAGLDTSGIIRYAQMDSSGRMVITGSLTISTTAGATDQGNAGSQGQGWYVKITDGTNILGTGSSSPIYITGSTQIVGIPQITGSVQVVGIPTITGSVSVLNVVTVTGSVASSVSIVNNTIAGTGSISPITGSFVGGKDTSGNFQPFATTTGGFQFITGSVSASIVGIPTITGSVQVVGIPQVTGSIQIVGIPTVTGSVQIVGLPSVSVSNTVTTTNITLAGTGSSSPVTGSLVGGKDTLSNFQAFKTDTSGFQFITGSVSASIVGVPTITGSVQIVGIPTITGSVQIVGLPSVSVSNTVTITNAALSVIGGGTEATAVRVTIANDSTGLVSVDDNGGSLTVDGTVTNTNITFAGTGSTSPVTGSLIGGKDTSGNFQSFATTTGGFQFITGSVSASIVGIPTITGSVQIVGLPTITGSVSVLNVVTVTGSVAANVSIINNTIAGTGSASPITGSLVGGKDTSSNFQAFATNTSGFQFITGSVSASIIGVPTITGSVQVVGIPTITGSVTVFSADIQSVVDVQGGTSHTKAAVIAAQASDNSTSILQADSNGFLKTVLQNGVAVKTVGTSDATESCVVIGISGDDGSFRGILASKDTATHGGLVVAGKDRDNSFKALATASGGFLLVTASIPSTVTTTVSNTVTTTNATFGVSGTAVPITGTLAGGKDTSNNFQAFVTDVSGNQGVSFSDGFRKTYSSSKAAITMAASCTDFFTITGGAAKTVRVIRIELYGIQTTAAGGLDFFVLKRSTANTGGTATSGTIVSHDSNNSAAVATVLGFTANPTTGTLVGAIRSGRTFVPAAVSPTTNYLFSWDFGNRPGQGIVLRGINQVLALNYNGATLTGGSVNCNVEWTEE